MAVDDQDESVRIAIMALGDMRKSSVIQQTPALSVSSSSPSASTTSLALQDLQGCQGQVQFASKVASLPFVNSALKAYEMSKASSSVVKYGAEMMESSVFSISSKLPVNVNTLDEFACRQLDRFGRYGRAGSTPQTPVTEENGPDRLMDLDIQMDTPSGESRVPRWLESTTPYIPRSISSPTSASASTSALTSPTPSSSALASTSQIHYRRPARARSPSGEGNDDDYDGDYPSRRRNSTSRSRSRSVTPQPQSRRASEQPVSEAHREVVQRSRWQRALLEAGGLSAALSEESMKRLKYCLQWLQYATAHIDAQILILRDFTAALQQPAPPAPPDSGGRHSRSSSQSYVSPAHLRTLTAVRRDLVHTIRQAVDVVSRYAGGALPEPARSRVRGFVLGMPKRWAAAAGTGSGAVSVPPSPALSATTDVLPGIDALSLSHTDLPTTTTRLREREREVVVAASAGRARRRPAAMGAIRGTGSAATESAGASPATSPLASPRVATGRLPGSSPQSVSGAVTARDAPGAIMGRDAAIGAAQRILALATESLGMMHSVTSVVKDSLDRADAWVGRLAVVGVGAGRAGVEGGDEQPEGLLEFPGQGRREGKGKERAEEGDEDAEGEDDEDEDEDEDMRPPSAGVVSPGASAGVLSPGAVLSPSATSTSAGASVSRFGFGFGPSRGSSSTSLSSLGDEKEKRMDVDGEGEGVRR
ncbi:transcription factor Opi1-domain-containing protein [Pterulicium gracile]|uniref:Transcription factor Opi1-domain-containing protein n=1 Tax=Pterulicium gracile TaxID=1884261 RepID=A0A5C3QSG5_9AGAR|nr:transcription factor Opi1-domain-containing protein [Pterula gracilis]